MDVWTMGDYASVGDWIREASLACLDGMEPTRLLDVACGMGTVALAAAAQGAQVTGVDVTPAMLEVARQRSLELGLDVTWALGSFEELGEHHGYDVVTSAFGVIFASDPSAVARELLGTLAPGGVISLTAWSPGGAFGMPPGLVALVPGLADAPDHADFADPARLSRILEEAGGALISRQERVLEVAFGSGEEAFESLLRDSGPWIQAFEGLRALGLEAQAAEVIRAHLDGFMRPGGGLRVDYVVVRFRAIS